MATKRKTNGHGRTPPIYKSYVFKDKDPAIDELRTLVEHHYGKRINGAMLQEICEDGGPSVGCMRAWFFGDTLRPQNPTLESCGRTLGYHRVWRRMKANEKEGK